MSNDREIPMDEPVDFEDFPHMDYDGKRFVKELEYQIFENPNWSNAERVWWNYLRNRFLACAISYEDAAKTAYMRGAEYGASAAYGLDESA